MKVSLNYNMDIIYFILGIIIGIIIGYIISNNKHHQQETHRPPLHPGVSATENFPGPDLRPEDP